MTNCTVGRPSIVKHCLQAVAVDSFESFKRCLVMNASLCRSVTIKALIARRSFENGVVEKKVIIYFCKQQSAAIPSHSQIIFTNGCWLLLNVFITLSSSQRPDGTTRAPPPAIASENVVNELISRLLSGNGGAISSDLQQNSINIPTVNGGTVNRDDPYWNASDILEPNSVNDETAALKFLVDYNKQAEEVFSKSAEAGWSFLTNMTANTRKDLAEMDKTVIEFLHISAKRAKQFNLNSIHNKKAKKQIKNLSQEGIYVLPEKKLEQFISVQAKINQVFADGTVCEPSRPPPCTMPLEPDLQRIMATSRDVNELYYVWLAWRNAVGPPMKQSYLEMVDLFNEIAKLNGLKHGGEIWQNTYGEKVNLIHLLEKIYDEVRPLYDQLHAYIRNQLRKQYASFMHQDGQIPAHLLAKFSTGDMSGSNWINLYPDSVPYPEHHPLDVNYHFKSLNYTVEKMVRTAEKLFTSMGFGRLPGSFWDYSIFVRPNDRDMVCYPAAFDFKNQKDFRIKMCAQVTWEDFIQIIRQMTSTYYQIAYKEQPISFREAANPAISYALTNALALSVSSEDFMHSVGILPDLENSQEKTINYLYNIALREVAFIPYGVLADKWRWSLFSGDIDATNMNEKWWEYRMKYQGVKSPARRDNDDFDPGSNYQIAQNLPFSRQVNVIGYVIQFQVLKGLCSAIGYQGPLHRCHFFEGKLAGEKLISAMKLGASENWTDVLKILSGSEEISGAAMMEYMEPLIQWLVKTNAETGEAIGWNEYPDQFNEAEITLAKNISKKLPVGDIKNNAHSVSDLEGIAFPGEDCSQGQQCLADSTCNGTVCVCPPNSVPWYQTCLPNDPTMVGFGPGGEGFQLDLIKGEIVTEESTSSQEESNDINGSTSSMQWKWLSIFSGVLFCLVHFKMYTTF
ncbi:Angiotensin-converting enzyme [Trichinella papuae]|uniref:Angiotensin-converting enzyme n=1 Tax=Trichinella papuae TaxID=268474 RepID=A0A0V1NAG7_9BILA|nr:Angiotensin-converting enzyme [Trichinella papuae]